MKASGKTSTLVQFYDAFLTNLTYLCVVFLAEIGTDTLQYAAARSLGALILDYCERRLHGANESPNSNSGATNAAKTR